MLRRTCTVAALGAAALAAAVPAQAAPASLELTHGIASGDVTPTSALVWARASGPAQIHVEVDDNPTLSSPRSVGTAAARQDGDFAARLEVKRLEPATPRPAATGSSTRSGRCDRTSSSPTAT